MVSFMPVLAALSLRLLFHLNNLVAAVEGLEMLSGGFNDSAHAHLGPHFSVDIMCAMGTGGPQFHRCPPVSRLPTPIELMRGLFCAQLLTRMLDPLAKPP